MLSLSAVTTLNKHLTAEKGLSPTQVGLSWVREKTSERELVEKESCQRPSPFSSRTSLLCAFSSLLWAQVTAPGDLWVGWRVNSRFLPTRPACVRCVHCRGAARGSALH